MKTTFTMICMTAIMTACNNDTDHGTHNEDTTKHTEHSTHTTDTTIAMVVKTMDNMMQEMHAAKPTGNNDVDFATMMMAHHKGAVEMSKLQLEKGSDPELKAFAQKVIDDQNKEIDFMQQFISSSPRTASADNDAFQNALNNSMQAMHGNTTVYNNTDKDFAAQMIPHHQSAVDMAKAYLKYGKNESLRKLCNNIISSQTKEINWLKGWLK